MSVWTQAEALALCARMEEVTPEFGCHVALTGGLLYKEGPRKDADILLYRIRQTPKIDLDGLFEALAKIGIERTRGYGWVHKARYQGKPIDLFFPEEKAVTSDDEDMMARGYPS